MAVIGYARVSSQSQSHDIQIKELQALGCEKIYQEKISGKSTNNREQLQSMIEYVREGDTVIVMKLDRLARNTIDALQIAQKLESKQVALKIMDIGDGIDITSGVGRLVFTTLSAIAEMERERINERTKAGRDAAQAKGIKFGRKPSINASEVIELKSQGLGATEIAKRLGIGRASVYRILSKENI